MKQVLLLLTMFSVLNVFAEDDNTQVRDFGKFSQIFIPSKKTFNYEEGTYQAWWRVNYDKSENFQKDINYPSIGLSMFSLRGETGNDWNRSFKPAPSMSFTLTDTKKGHLAVFKTRLAESKPSAPARIIMKFDSLKWDKAAWHYFAVTWKKEGENYKLTMVCDDVSKSITCKATKLDFKSFGEPIVNIGNMTASRGTLDAVGMYKRALSLEELSKAYKAGVIKEKDMSLYLSSSEILKLKEISISKITQKQMIANESKKKLKIYSRGNIYLKPQVVEGKFNKKAFQMHSKNP
ncbi:MAG: hypothetical protein NE330_07475 [Lentisphaeraceae bacterium]|nr:hypothetical protein [Lentisphaeraceae bacterium]